MGFATTFFGKLSSYAETVSVIKATGGTYDPTTGGVTGETETTYTGSGIFTTYSDRLIDGAVIQSGDLQCELLAYGLTFTPEGGDTLLRGTDRLEIVSVKTRTFSQGEIVSYHLQVRGRG